MLGSLLTKGFALGLLTGLVCVGQAVVPNVNPLTSLEQAATKTHDDWLRLATGLETRVARVLPCDPSATATIEEATRASAARIVALGAYLKASADQAAQDIDAARKIQEAQRALLATNGQERADTEQERAGIESQINNLAESVKKKASLGPAADQLKNLDAMVQDRANTVSKLSSNEDTTATALNGLLQSLERREKALRQQIPLLEEERTRWNGYYSARMARARIECSVTGGR
ncbi:MAG: hypothetical protein ABI995_12330 [Acidobacteriota bacterium]